MTMSDFFYCSGTQQDCNNQRQLIVQGLIQDLTMQCLFAGIQEEDYEAWLAGLPPGWLGMTPKQQFDYWYNTEQQAMPIADTFWQSVVDGSGIKFDPEPVTECVEDITGLTKQVAARDPAYEGTPPVAEKAGGYYSAGLCLYQSIKYAVNSLSK